MFFKKFEVFLNNFGSVDVDSGWGFCNCWWRFLFLKSPSA